MTDPVADNQALAPVAGVVTDAGPAVATGQTTYTPDLASMKRLFDDARTLTATARKESEIDIDYFDTKQFTSSEKKVLAKRGQPDIAFNRIKPAVNGMRGVIERGRSDPRAYPRTPNNEDAADVATDVLRYIADYSRFKETKGDLFQDILVPGTGAVQITVDGDRQVIVTQVRWEEFFYDPRSRRNDFKDARYLGIAAWKYADDVAAMYPDKRTEVEGAMGGAPLGGDATFNDRPLSSGSAQPWIDKKLRRMMVVDLYHKEQGTWRRCVFHAGGLLEAGDSPYKDHKGRPDCPIEAESAFVDRENNRYGVVRDMRGPQDEINKRRSKLLHHISVSQIQAVDPSAQAIDPDTARAEAAKPDGVIPFGWQKVPTTDMATGHAQLLAEAKAEIERMGPNPAILGRQGGDSSGRAVLARQQAGLVELAPVFSRLESVELRIYRQMWARAKQFWTAPMWIRVTEDEDTPKFVGLNQPQHEMEMIPHPLAGTPVVDPSTGQPAQHPETGQPLTHPPVMTDDQGQPIQQPRMYQAVDPATGQPATDPTSGAPVLQPRVLGYKNTVAEMDVDIILDSEPDTANIQAEQFETLVQLAASNPVYAQQIPFDVIFGLSAFPHKRQVIDKIKAAQEAQAPAQQQQQQIQQQAATAKIAETASKAKLNEANAGKATVTTLLAAHQAGHDSVIPIAQPTPQEAMQGGSIPQPALQ